MKAGWTEVALGDVATIDRRSVTAAEIVEGTLYLGLEDIDAGGGAVRPHPVQAGELGSNKFVFNSQHILYGKLRPYLAKIAPAPGSGICSTDILPIRPTGVDQTFLLHFLRQPKIVGHAAARSSGANLPRLAPTELEKFRLPLPPMDEQKRIAAVLDKAGELQSKRRAAIAHLDSLTEAIFLNMFGDPARNPMGWHIKSLGQLGDWKAGGTPPRSQPEYFGGDVPWFTSGELGEVFVGSSVETITAEALVETSARRVPTGALMLGMYDTAALKSSIATTTGSCNQAVAFAAIDRAEANVRFVYSAVQAGREHFRRLQRGVRQKNLNLAMIRSIEIPCPEVTKQDAFERLAVETDVVREQMSFQARRADALFKSLQARAFGGELR